MQVRLTKKDGSILFLPLQIEESEGKRTVFLAKESIPSDCDHVDFMYDVHVTPVTDGYMLAPLGIYVYVSEDEGESWVAHELPTELPNTADFGYPATTERDDGSFFTVWYQHLTDDSPAVIVGSSWRFA